MLLSSLKVGQPTHSLDDSCIVEYEFREWCVDVSCFIAVGRGDQFAGPATGQQGNPYVCQQSRSTGEKCNSCRLQRVGSRSAEDIVTCRTDWFLRNKSGCCSSTVCFAGKIPKPARSYRLFLFTVMKQLSCAHRRPRRRRPFPLLTCRVRRWRPARRRFYRIQSRPRSPAATAPAISFSSRSLAI